MANKRKLLGNDDWKTRKRRRVSEEDDEEDDDDDDEVEEKKIEEDDAEDVGSESSDSFVCQGTDHESDEDWDGEEEIVSNSDPDETPDEEGDDNDDDDDDVKADGGDEKEEKEERKREPRDAVVPLIEQPGNNIQHGNVDGKQQGMELKRNRRPPRQQGDGNEDAQVAAVADEEAEAEEDEFEYVPLADKSWCFPDNELPRHDPRCMFNGVPFCYICHYKNLQTTAVIRRGPNRHSMWFQDDDEVDIDAGPASRNSRGLTIDMNAVTIQNMIETYRSISGGECLRSVCVLLKQMYEEVKPFIGLEWRMEIIHEHVTQHDTTPETRLQHIANDLATVANIIKDNSLVMRSRINGRKVIDSANCRTYKDMVSLLVKVQTSIRPT